VCRAVPSRPVDPEWNHMIVANMQLNKVVEYDFDGNELWSFPATTPWGVHPAFEWDLLITDRIGVREINSPRRYGMDVRSVRCSRLQILDPAASLRLSNGDTVVSNWVNEWSTKPEERRWYFYRRWN